jgi:hypothetical protein
MNEYVVLSWYNRFEVAEQVGMDPDDLLVIWRQTANAGFYCLFYRRETEKWRTPYRWRWQSTILFNRRFDEDQVRTNQTIAVP